MPTEKLYHGATLQLPGHCEWWQVNIDQPFNLSNKLDLDYTYCNLQEALVGH